MGAGSLTSVFGPTSLRWRVLRSSAFAVVAAALAGLGHVIGGSGPPDAAVLVVGAGGVALICTGLTRRRRSVAGIAGLLIACQLAFHLLFSLSPHLMASGPTASSGLAASSGLTASSGLLPTAPLRMLAVHGIATALSALTLAKGEKSLFKLFAVLRRAVRVVLLPGAVGLPPQWAAAVAYAWPHPSGALLSTSPRRGPPVAR